MEANGIPMALLHDHHPRSDGATLRFHPPFFFISCQHGDMPFDDANEHVRKVSAGAGIRTRAVSLEG